MLSKKRRVCNNATSRLNIIKVAAANCLGDKMAHYTGKKNRIARRFGANVFGRARNPLLHKPNPPGMHGARRRKKSDFGVQLEEKQKLKAIYGMISEKQLINYFKKAVKLEANTAQILAQMLECRLDVVVHRLKFGSTIFAAQQLVSHGHILVNGKKVDRRSFQVSPGMVISVREKSRGIKAIQEAQDSGMRSVPEYLSVDKENFSGQLLEYPSYEQMPWPIEIRLPEICDFLAHTT
ncbi:MAG: 30S ribosomal protein S4 [Parachlamydia sp.]|nr:MAG: 30S ribosomal protein S4 [Parachlamydia sp.]